MEQYRRPDEGVLLRSVKYDTYLEQLGIKYPTVKPAPTGGTGDAKQNRVLAADTRR